MNSRKQITIQAHLSHLLYHPPLIRNSSHTILSPVYQNKVLNVLDSPHNKRYILPNLPSKSATNTTLPEPPRILDSMKRKPKQFKNINKSMTVSQPSLNSSLRNRSYQSNQNIHYTHQQGTEQSQKESESQSTEKVEEECLLSTIIPAQENNLLRIKCTKKLEQSKELFDAVHYRMVQSSVVTQSNIQDFQVEESVIEEREFLENFVLLKEIRENQFLSIQEKLGFSLVIKIVPTERIEAILLEMKEIEFQHPMVVKTYQCVLNNSASFVVLREVYEEYFWPNLGKYSHRWILACVQQTINLFQDLQSKGIRYLEKLSQNLVVANSTAKLLLTSKSTQKVGQNIDQQRFYRPLVDFLSELRQSTKSKTMLGRLETISKLLTDKTPFQQIAKHKVFHS